MVLKEKIKTDLIRTLKAKDSFTVGALRFLLAQVKDEEIAKRRELTEEELVTLLRSQIKKRKESIEFFIKGSRADLVAKEQKEIELINSYLPKSLDEEEIRKTVQALLSQLTEPEKKNFGLVMGKLMKDLKGKTDGQTVSRILKEEIAK